jgi:hypothetical protein
MSKGSISKNKKSDDLKSIRKNEKEEEEEAINVVRIRPRIVY